MKIRKQNQIARTIAFIPQFNFTTVDNRSFTKKDMNDTLGKVIFQVFSPDCIHCQRMADSLVKHRTGMQRIEMVMVTPFGDSSSVAQFINDHHLDSLPDSHFLMDKTGEFFRLFGYTGVPSFFIYDNNKLLRKIKGETKITNLIGD